MNAIKATYNGKPATILQHSKGWYRIEVEGETLNVRAKALEFATSTDAVAATIVEPATTEAPMKAKSDKPSKTKKAKKSSKPRRAAVSKKAKTTHVNGAIVRTTPEGKEYTYARVGKTESGAVAYDCGDEAAKMLRGKTLDEVYEITAKHMLKAENLKGDYAGCTTADGIVRKLRASLKDANVGRQRMTLGNRLRAALRG